MANLSTTSLILTILCLFVSTLDVYARKQGPVTEEETLYFRDICLGQEKVVNIIFYVQDLGVNAVNTTTYTVANASITSTSPTSFGQVRVIDDLLTAEPDANSAVVGRIQGVNTKSDLTVLAININLNIYFTSAPYNGSTLTVLGRNQIGNAQRELPIVGGTGVFRFARGYAIQSTYAMLTDRSVLLYDIYTTYNNATAIEHSDM